MLASLTGLFKSSSSSEAFYANPVFAGVAIALSFATCLYLCRRHNAAYQQAGGGINDILCNAIEGVAICLEACSEIRTEPGDNFVWLP